MKKVLVLLLFLATFAAPFSAVSQNQEAKSQKIHWKSIVNYQCYIPENHDGKMPLIIFLHGSGERGNDINLVKKWGPPQLIDQGKKFPFIVLSPQCPEGRWWDIYELDHWLDEMIDKYPVDINRIYLTGLSMGGFATWQWSCAFPCRFAAIAPVCGGGDLQFADELKEVPVWAFHGQDDPVVPVSRTTEMVEAVNTYGGNAKATVYPGVGHDSWIKAYNTEELYSWFLQFKKNNH